MRKRYGSVDGANPHAILLLTGSFNPIHKGHLHMLDYAREQLNQCYETIMGIVSPTHDQYVSTKPGAKNSQTRCTMARLAVADRENDSVDDWECNNLIQGRWIDYPGVIRHFVETNKDTDVYYVVGQDHYERNVQYDKRIDQSCVIVVPRTDADLSSTKVRETNDFATLCIMVPQNVAEYIQNNRLYGFHVGSDDCKVDVPSMYEADCWNGNSGRVELARSVNLGEVLSMYKYDFFHDEQHRQFVQDNFEADTATLITVNAPDVAVLKSHLQYRVPVYFGRTMHSHFDNDALDSVLGYNSNFAEYRWAKDEPQYAIVGPVKMMNDRNNVAVIHTWGVNLESYHTHDYNKYVKNGWDTDSYTKRYEDMFRLIVRAAEHVAGDKLARVRCPLIGMGAFLGALSDPSKAHQCFVNAANTVFSTEHKNVDFTFCIFQQGHPLISQLNDVQNVSLGIGSTNGNLMKLPDFDPNIMDVVVNAWDNRSFVGNGGSRDGTIDGFVVANAGGFNNDFRNTSYLHNFFFNPSMRDPSNWVSVEYYLCQKSM